ncbi:MAG: TIGR04283 family arsenosugar biosynthesis glycosyltransferase [Nitrospirae bacterium]|nr:TIGR04283 family arsenosugar biosynthesis glycosyltransferase [Nitrospirota bacterium]
MLSVIVPVLNEAKTLRNYLSMLAISECEELIVIDGGSSDDTMAVAGEFTEKVFPAGTGRASAMNFGATKSSGDILLFLHADCILPEDAFTIIRETLRDASVAAGAFELAVEHPGIPFRLIEMGTNLRARAASLLYGDQGMFLRKAVFERIGGFADIPLMEDLEISWRLKSSGRIVFVKPPIKASPRRWLNEGILYTTLRDWMNAFSYTFLKVSPDRLIQYYRDIR